MYVGFKMFFHRLSTRVPIPTIQKKIPPRNEPPTRQHDQNGVDLAAIIGALDSNRPGPSSPLSATKPAPIRHSDTSATATTRRLQKQGPDEDDQVAVAGMRNPPLMSSRGIRAAVRIPRTRKVLDRAGVRSSRVRPRLPIHKTAAATCNLINHLSLNRVLKDRSRLPASGRIRIHHHRRHSRLTRTRVCCGMGVFMMTAARQRPVLKGRV
ncbi:hypothetical protein LX36DRAFT_242991 [Colletotrichum falcatum]|nr:hypothetical protein LX36DRAFT_242991 [Colletotrichum falcatum]